MERHGADHERKHVAKEDGHGATGYLSCLEIVEILKIDVPEKMLAEATVIRRGTSRSSTLSASKRSSSRRR